MNKARRIIITPGDPAGIGIDLAIGLCQTKQSAEFVVIGDPDCIQARATMLGLPIEVDLVSHELTSLSQTAQRMNVLPIKLAETAVPGKPSLSNAKAIIDSIDSAVKVCLEGKFDALVTGPVNKAVINQAGISFTGHTERIAELCDSPLPVMMLVGNNLRVALATTHLPLADVPKAVTKVLLTDVINIVLKDMQRWFGLSQPQLKVCGLNPHAGDGGYIGTEEQRVIEPTIEWFQKQGHRVSGPYAADTLFLPRQLDAADAVLCMYHDQGLPVLKYASFGEAVNLTLGLPIIRTSVDHGTAYDLAGTGLADGNSFQAAINMAVNLATNKIAMST